MLILTKDMWSNHHCDDPLCHQGICSGLPDVYDGHHGF